MNVLGEVLCKETCGSSVSVTLVRVGRREDRKPVYLTDESSAFLFTNVLPGKYRFEVLCLSAIFYFIFMAWSWLFLLAL